MSDTSLDAILDAAPAEAKPATVPATEPAPETVTDAAAVELGTEATGEKPKEQAPPAVPEKTDDPRQVPIKALEDERRKRQDLEKKFDDLLRQVQQQQPKQQQPIKQEPPQPPDPFVDPEGAMQWQRQMFEHQLFERAVVMSREMMLAKPDFEEMEGLFVEAAQNSPMLVQQLRAHPMPAKFAYETGRRIKAQREIGDDPDAYKARLREELMAELQAQHQPAASSNPGQTVKAAPAPKTLAGTPSAQPRDNRGRFSEGPASLEQILGG